MPRLLLKALFFLTGICISGMAFAQDSLSKEAPQMASGMRSSGKIYVVVAVLVIILTGLFVYLIRLDGKISRLEKKLE